MLDGDVCGICGWELWEHLLPPAEGGKRWSWISREGKSGSEVMQEGKLGLKYVGQSYSGCVGGGFIAWCPLRAFYQDEARFLSSVSERPHKQG